MSSNTVIHVEGLWKRYGLPLRPAYLRARDRLLGRLNASPEAYGPWALKDLNIEVQQGEILGIVGRNGAGKSTLLKILAGVTRPTRGTYRASGLIFPMIELTAGMHTELSGYENIYLLGAVMGLSRSQIRAGMDAIADFSELGEWLERPVRMYSSGMLVRLGFAVAVNVDADILLVDEVLAVGDLAFRAKCYEYIHNLQRSGTTVLFVSHSIPEVRRICTRAVLMSQGRVIMTDRTDAVIAEYQRQSQDGSMANIVIPPGGLPQSIENSGHIRVTGVTLLDAGGHELDAPVFHQPLTLRLGLHVIKPVAHPQIHMGFARPDGEYIAFMVYRPPENAPLLQPGPTYIDCRIESLPLLTGSFTIYATLEESSGLYKLEVVRNVREIFIAPGTGERANPAAGLFQIEAEWQPAREPAGASDTFPVS